MKPAFLLAFSAFSVLAPGAFAATCTVASATGRIASYLPPKLGDVAKIDFDHFEEIEAIGFRGRSDRTRNTPHGLLQVLDPPLRRVSANRNVARYVQNGQNFRQTWILNAVRGGGLRLRVIEEVLYPTESRITGSIEMDCVE